MSNTPIRRALPAQLWAEIQRVLTDVPPDPPPEATMEALRTSYQLFRPLLQRVFDSPAVPTSANLQATLDTRTAECNALRADLETRTAERDASDTLARENQVRLDTLNASITKVR
jgi:hypothetical protein